MAEKEFIEVNAQKASFEHVLPNINQWPITKLYSDKSAFVKTVVERTLIEIFKNSNTVEKLEAEVARTYFSEHQRLKRKPWKADKPDEKHFWESIKNETNDIEAHSSAEEKYDEYKTIVRAIVERYANEISITFDPKVFHFAKRFLSFSFATLLNKFRPKNVKAIFDYKLFIQDRFKIRGDIDKIRNLTTKGTIVLLPTHHSNIDSIVIGWALQAIGLPSFIFAAGLNLYNSKFVGYFMERLGAYKVDRRKKNPIYLETLKQFSTISLENNIHSLIFPGGTRSRDGSIDHRLKLGLIGTAFDAQRNNFIQEELTGQPARQIYVVPLTFSYNFVLEAKSLIRQYLKNKDAEKYYFNRKDEVSNNSNIASFIFKMLGKKSEVYLSFGEPMDLFGNEINDDGESVFNGQKVPIKDYFISDGELKENKQRENVYSKDLGNLVAKRLLKTNIVLSSHLVPFVIFELLMKKFNAKTVYELFEYDTKDHNINRELAIEHVDNLMKKVIELGNIGELKYNEDFKLTPEQFLEKGVQSVGVFHNNKPLTILKNGDIASEDIELLYYYHNRMNGYNLEKYI